MFGEVRVICKGRDEYGSGCDFSFECGVRGNGVVGSVLDDIARGKGEVYNGFICVFC